MKGIRLFAVLSTMILTLHMFGAWAQTEVINQIRETIKAGSAKELSRYLNQNIDVNIEGKVETYSKPQAEFVFRDFFKQHPPTDFNILHQGSSKGGQLFAIGMYYSGSETYRIFMKLKMQNNQQLLHEVTFSKE